MYSRDPLSSLLCHDRDQNASKAVSSKYSVSDYFWESLIISVLIEFTHVVGQDVDISIAQIFAIHIHARAALVAAALQLFDEAARTSWTCEILIGSEMSVRRVGVTRFGSQDLS